MIFHNTLAASEYGLLAEPTFAPRPNFRAALLWRRLMGTTVLDAGVPMRAGLHVYAHCQAGRPGSRPSGGVTVLAINTSRTAAAAVGRVELAPATITYRTVAGANDPACR